MPAAAVIPAPIAYIKVVAVKKLVVEVWVVLMGASKDATRFNAALVEVDQMPERVCGILSDLLWKN